MKSVGLAPTSNYHTSLAQQHFDRCKRIEDAAMRLAEKKEQERKERLARFLSLVPKTECTEPKVEVTNDQINSAWEMIGQGASVMIIGRIQSAVALEFGVSKTNIISARRTKDVVLPRHVAIYLSRELTLRTLPQIGRLFGGRDHTTVLHACRKVAERIERDPEFAARVKSISDRFRSEDEE